MGKWRRERIQKQRTSWTVAEWRRGWKLAMMRIDGCPEIVEQQPIFRRALALLDDSFAAGNSSEFERGLVTLLDYCARVVNRGVCKQWWPNE